MQDNIPSPVLKQLYKNVSIQYKLFLLIISSVLILGCFHLFPKISISDESLISFESFSVIITLGTIPFSLKKFKRMVDKLGDVSEESTKLKHYKKLVAYRFSLLSFVCIGNMILFFLLGPYSFLLNAGMIFVCSFFCIPSIKNMISDLDMESLKESDSN